jgi:hypothetical protein
MAALLEGHLARTSTGLGVADATGLLWTITWPAGYAVRGNELVDPSKAVVARVGDRLSISGGQTGDQQWLACGAITPLAS